MVFNKNAYDLITDTGLNNHDNNNNNDTSNNTTDGTVNNQPDNKNTNIDPNNQDDSNYSLIQKKRSRSTKACILCHNRKVKCDVATKGANGKCTNCLFSDSECVIYVRKKRSANKKRQVSSSGSSVIPPMDPSKTSNLNTNGNANTINNSDNSDDESDNNDEAQPSKAKTNDVSILSSNMNDLDSCKENKPSSNIPNFSSNFLKPSAQDQYPHLSAIKLDPNVVLKENMHDLMKTEFGIKDNTNYFMKEILNSALNKITESYKRTYSLDQVEFKILEDMGCLTLPDEKTCWKCIDNFFEYINPQLPLIDKTNFYETYSDLRNPPSLLLLYSVLFAGAWHSNSESENAEEQFESVRIAQLFFKRAKFLYEYSIECEPIALIQSLFCFSFNNETMSNIAKNDYYWIHIAICIAYEYGFHLKPSESLPAYTRKMQKRLWWLLFYKDRITAFGYARPSAININDCDQEMLTLDDLSNSGMTHLEKVYLLNLIQFGKLLDKIGAIQHEITKLFVTNRPVLHLMKKCDLIMIKFLQNLPKELKFKFNDKSTHSFLALMTLSQYYTLLIVIHRANILRHSADIYPSWAITFQAVQMIKLLSDCLVAKNLIKKVALLSHNTLTTPAIIMLYHLLNEDEKISKIANDFFLRILGIWRATYRKFPVCYPMICIFGYIYNSEEHLKQIVKSVAPTYDDDSKKNTNNKSNSTADTDSSRTTENEKSNLKLPDLSFIANSDFKIPTIPDPLNLKSDKNVQKFENLGINFDKLFTESVFAKGETLVPKLDLESISQNSKLNPANKTESNLEKEMKIEIKKEHGDIDLSNIDPPTVKPEHGISSKNYERNQSINNTINNSAIPTQSSSPSISVGAGSAAQTSSLDFNNMESNGYIQQENPPMVNAFNDLIFSNNMLDYDNQEFDSKQQQQQMQQHQHHQQQYQQHPQMQQQQQPQMQHHHHNQQQQDPQQTDVPISLWMMETTWRPKFNIRQDNDTEEITKMNQNDEQRKRVGELNEYDRSVKAENFYGDVYQIMGSTFNEVRQDNNSEGGSVINSNDNAYPVSWNNDFNDEPSYRYQLPAFDRFTQMNMTPNSNVGENNDTLHKYMYANQTENTMMRSTMSKSMQSEIPNNYNPNGQNVDNTFNDSGMLKNNTQPGIPPLAIPAHYQQQQQPQQQSQQQPSSQIESPNQIPQCYYEHGQMPSQQRLSHPFPLQHHSQPMIPQQSLPTHQIQHQQQQQQQRRQHSYPNDVQSRQPSQHQNLQQNDKQQYQQDMMYAQQQDYNGQYQTPNQQQLQMTPQHNMQRQPSRQHSYPNEIHQQQNQQYQQQNYQQQQQQSQSQSQPPPQHHNPNHNSQQQQQHQNYQQM